MIRRWRASRSRVACNGRGRSGGAERRAQALDYLRKLVDEGKKPEEEFLMMISDIEMPEMDGYTLTAEIRSDPRMQKLHIILHTSLSGVFNQAMVKKVGADDFLAKFRLMTWHPG
jgi:two-component system chemotaxis response regulator CheV